jgi:dihydrofolate reductase
VLASEIDRLVLKVNPVVLGDGIPMIDGGYDPGSFELVSTTRYESGVLLNEYVRRQCPESQVRGQSAGA